MHPRDFLASSAAALIHESVHRQMPILGGGTHPMKADHSLIGQRTGNSGRSSVVEKARVRA
jgi:hypothetical protein